MRAGGADTRLLSFESAPVAVELEVSPGRAGLSVRGLVTGSAGAVALEVAGDRWAAEVSADGWFVLDGVASGPARLHLVEPTARP